MAESVRDNTDNHFNLMGLALPTLEGWWRGGLRGSGGNVKLPDASGALEATKHTSGATARQANAAMLEKFAGVDGGGGAGALNGAPNGGGINALGVLNTLGGIYGLGTGIYDAINGKETSDRMMGVANAALGGISTVSGIANMANVGMSAGTGVLATAQNVLHGMTSVGGAGLGGGGLAGSIGESMTWVGKGAGAAGAGTLLSTVASLASAGMAGYGIGNYANDHAARSGVLGKKADGSNKSVSDWAWDKGSAVDDRVRGFVGGEDGSFRSGVGSVIGTVASGVTQTGAGVIGAGWSALDGLVGAGFDAASSVRDWWGERPASRTEDRASRLERAQP